MMIQKQIPFIDCYDAMCDKRICGGTTYVQHPSGEEFALVACIVVRYLVLLSLESIGQRLLKIDFAHQANAG